MSLCRGLHLYLVVPVLVTLFFSLCKVETTQAQVTPPITPSGLNTHVSGPTIVGGGTQYNITGGTRPGGGTNLFHSFGDFNVPTNNIANFLNAGSVDLAGNPLAAGLPTSNILGRVTDVNPSIIFGTIQTNGIGGFGNANLFLMNPHGFLFGPNATVNVGGMVAFTTADYLRLAASGVLFNATPNAAADALLSAAPVAAFGFLGSNPAAIAVQGSTLRVAPGQSISLVGGNGGFEYTDPDTGNTASTSVPGGVTMTGGKLSAPGGQINVASVASPGEVSAADFMPAAGMTMGNINLSQGATLDVSGDASGGAAGTVRIRGGEFVMTESTISANTINANGASTAIDINVTGDLSISNNTVSALTARTSGSGNAGEISITSNNLTVRTTPNDSSFALIDSHTDGTGQAGKVTIHTDTLDASAANGGAYLIDSGTAAEGNGNDVTITAKSVSLNDMSISTGDFRAIFSTPQNFNATGSGGNITLTADSLNLAFAVLASQAFQGQAGDVALTAPDISMNATLIGSTGLLGSGAVTIAANQLIMSNGSQIEAETAFAPGKDIKVTTDVLELTNASIIRTQTSGPEPAGNIVITATDHITLSDPPTSARPSGFYSNSIGVPDVPLDTLGGNAGSIVVTTPQLTMLGGARIDSTTQTSGRGGDVTINTTGPISIAGELKFTPPEDFFTLGSTTAGGIFTRSIGSEFCSGPCGNAGNISITAGSLTLGSGAQINSSTSTAGHGGDITIQASDSISLSGTLNNGDPVGVFSRTIGTASDSGSGGNIALTAGQSVTISNGASVSASSTGPGNAGNVTIEGTQSPAQSVLIDGPGSGIFTNTEGTGAGGNIFVNANSVTLQNGGTLSAITTGTGATATGGTIKVDASQVLLNNQANITATSISHPDKPNSGAGNAGTITVTAEENIVLLGNSSIVSAAQGEGNGGLVSLTAPSIEMHGISNIVTATAGLGNAGDIELQGSQVNLFTESFVSARTQAEGRGGNITIRGLTGEGSRATDVRLSDHSYLLSQTSGDGENIQGAAGNILVETARLNLSGGSLFNTASQGSTGAAGNITVNATDSLTISGSGSQLNSESIDTSFGDAGHISISAPSVVIENNGHISTSTSLMGNAGTITVNTNNLQLLSGGHITSSSLPESPVFRSGAAGTVSIQGLASPAQSVLIDGPGSGIFTDTRGTGAGGNILVNANSVTLQNAGTLSATTSGTTSSATGGTITIDANQVQLNSRATITANSAGAADAGSINITATNGLSMQNSSITTLVTPSDTGSSAGGGNIKVTTSPEATVWLQQHSMISASVADGPGGGGNISIDPQFVILQNSQILAQAAQGQGGAITITANLFLPDANSIVSADSGSGVNGTVTIQSPNDPAGGKIQPLGKSPLQATSLLNQRCASLAGGEFSSFTVAGRDSLPTEPGSWLASPLATMSAGTGLAAKGEGERPVARGEGLEGMSLGTSLAGETAFLSLRQIAPAGFLIQAFAVDWSAGCQS